MRLLSKGRATYRTRLTGLDQGDLASTIGDSLTYHLHSGIVGPNGECGGDFTAGHYDPTLACGGATTAPLCSEADDGAACCEERPAPGYCEDGTLETCEVGDLSGLHGAIPVEGGIADHFVRNGRCPDCGMDYDPMATAQDGTALFDTWASVVFHGIDNQRVLCADLVEVEDDDLRLMDGIEEILGLIGTE